MTKRLKGVRWVLLAAMLPLAACDSLLDVKSPGRIADTDLNSKDAIPGMVVGMKYDLSQAVDVLGEFLALAAVDLYHGGSYDWADVPRGIILDEDVGTEWSNPQQARWVAERGLERMADLLDADEYARSSNVAQANVYAGYANRILGENFCSTAINGGAEEPNTVHFERARTQFTEAIAVGGAAGRADIVNQAYAGRASVNAWLGDWTAAAADAARVPADFVFWAEIDTEMRNELAYETHNRYEYTVWGTFMQQHPDDARAPWVIAYNNDGTVANGANGTTPMYQQQKYEVNGADVALSKGTEMLLLRAEAALRDNDATRAYGFMNLARDFYAMPLLTPAATLAGAWEDLRYERGATLWLEGRRLHDLRRWFEDSGPAHSDALRDRARCLPISEGERLSNANLRG